MSESDVDVGSPGSDDSGPLYPVEGKFKDSSDKAYVEGLPEVEREAIIAERKELDERKRQDNYLKRLHQKYKAENEGKATPKKRKATDGEEEGRRSARKRTMVGGRKVGETSSTLEAYKARREQKNLLAEQRKAGTTDRKSRAHSVSDHSDADADGESDLEWDERGGSARRDEPVYEEPADLRDFHLVQVGRNNFARVCFYPGFEETVRNCYARVNIGGDPATGEASYRMAKITGMLCSTGIPAHLTSHRHPARRRPAVCYRRAERQAVHHQATAQGVDRQVGKRVSIHLLLHDAGQ
jgi:RNA polymerase-associated protein RTF1